MSILIKGMEMPTSCIDCKVRTANGCCGNLPHNTRMPNCPLVPVPKHGRLIDADAFSAKIIEIVERQGYDESYAQTLSIGAILREVVSELRGEGLDGYANAHTIIPADPAEVGTDFFTAGHLHLGYAEEGER